MADVSVDLPGGIGRERAWSAAVAVTCGGLIALSATLEPSSAGHGTHRQLGLGECSFLALTGHPCPMCGATTSFALMADLRPWDALVAQPFAVLLFALVAASFGVSVAEFVDPTGRWGKVRRWIEPRETRLAIAFMIAMGVGWAYKWMCML